MVYSFKGNLWEGDATGGFSMISLSPWHIHGDWYTYLLISHKQSTKRKFIMANILYMDQIWVCSITTFFCRSSARQCLLDSCTIKKQSHVSHVHSLDILYLKKPRLWCKCIKTGINSCISTFSSRHVLRWNHFCLASWKPLSLQGSRWKRPCCFALKDSKAFALSISTPSRSNDSSMQLPQKIPFLLGSMVKLGKIILLMKGNKYWRYTHFTTEPWLWEENKYKLTSSRNEFSPYTLLQTNMAMENPHFM